MELYTVLVEVKERSHGRCATDPDNGATICSNDLLLGGASPHVPHGAFHQSKILRYRFLFFQHFGNSFILEKLYARHFRQFSAAEKEVIERLFMLNKVVKLNPAAADLF
ncbi:hypothetical protein GQR58_010040 [Nymphon striatum]|nr:hypothetical protein GQR58_010040 [Nymphon striatum]